MKVLETLTEQARALAQGEPGLHAAQTEVARQMQICNACRYCEGFCAVFPAMTRRLEFGKADVHFLANLCHNCGACLHACQYASPHEFAVNVPQAMARVRVNTYTVFAWPPALGGLYQRNGLTVSLALVAALAFFLMLAVAANGALFQAPVVGAGSFYAIFPHNLLVSLFVPVFLFVVVAMGISVRHFWREISPAQKDMVSGAGSGTAALTEATANALSLKYLGGGHGEGCHNADDAWTHWRRRFHHATFYGFMLCFAATCVGTLYHYAFGWIAPYDWPSLPKLLGVVGGVSLCIGAVGLFWLNLQRHPQHGDAAQKVMDLGFIALLFVTSLSGLALWLGRSTPALAALLSLHLAAVMALFLTLPYGKFAHGLYRSAALLKWAIEKRQPGKLALGDD